MSTFALLAQLAEHNTFNVGVLGSNPKGRTQPLSERLCSGLQNHLNWFDSSMAVYKSYDKTTFLRCSSNTKKHR